MAKKNGKTATLCDLVVKDMGTKAWVNLSNNDKKVVRELSKIDRMGGPPGSAVSAEYQRSNEE